MKKIIHLITVLLTALFATSAVQAVATDAIFHSVSGKVKVKDSEGKTRTVRDLSKAMEGEEVIVEEGGGATLQFFDGSTLEAKPHSRFVLSVLQKLSDKEKMLRFKLDSGGLMARVQKLLTANSIFEIAAGGVVCGVRGTRFSVDYDPAQDKVDLKVLEGTVYTRAGGQTHDVHAGQQMEFLKDKAVSAAEGKDLESTAGFPAVHPGSVMAGVSSLALDDLNAQFTADFSITGKAIGKSPAMVLSGFQPNTQWMIGGGTSAGLQITNPIGILPVKLVP